MQSACGSFWLSRMHYSTATESLLLQAFGSTVLRFVTIIRALVTMILNGEGLCGDTITPLQAEKTGDTRCQHEYFCTKVTPPHSVLGKDS